MKKLQPENPVFRYTRGEDDAARRGVSRRKMVQQLLTGVGGTAALTSMARAQPTHDHGPTHAPDPSGAPAAASARATPAEWSPQFLDAHQNETLVVLAERIVPGSTGVQANRMIDLLLSVDSQKNQRKFVESISAFDGEAIKRHSQPFATLTEERQVAILTDASKAESGQTHRYDNWWDSNSTSEEESPMTLRDHFENTKDWVVKCYYASEAGLKELGWTGQVAWDSFPDCDHSEGHK